MKWMLLIAVGVCGTLHVAEYPLSPWGEIAVLVGMAVLGRLTPDMPTGTRLLPSKRQWILYAMILLGAWAFSNSLLNQLGLVQLHRWLVFGVSCLMVGGLARVVTECREGLDCWPARIQGLSTLLVGAWLLYVIIGEDADWIDLIHKVAAFCGILMQAAVGRKWLTKCRELEMAGTPMELNRLRF